MMSTLVRSTKAMDAGLETNLTVKDVTKILNCGTTTVENLLSRQELPSFTIGRLRRIRPNDLKRFIDDRVSGNYGLKRGGKRG